jgi:hypothetical protein
MGAANERWFKANDTLADATGISLRQAIEHRYGAAEPRPVGGMDSPDAVTLPVGTRIVRFDGSSRPSLAAQGKWWMEWAQYQRLATISRAAATDLNTIFRQLCYVPAEWNNLHVVIQAQVVAPLMAYRGAGVPVAKVGPTVAVANILGASPIIQLYIPGLASDAGKQAIAIERQSFQPGTV